MRILIANDDGIYSPGIAALAEVAAKFGDVRIVAPDVEMSSAGHAITSSRPLSYKRTPIRGFEAYRVNGTPADCVALGAHIWERVDVVLSGINLGSNLGNSMWHSGTLAAAKQAVLLGLRGIALSAPVTSGEPDFEALKLSVDQVLELIVPAVELTLVNVNFPDGEPRACAGRASRSATMTVKSSPVKTRWGGSTSGSSLPRSRQAEEGTDRWAVEQGYVSMTPLRLDLTNEAELTRARSRYPLS